MKTRVPIALFLLSWTLVNGLREDPDSIEQDAAPDSGGAGEARAGFVSSPRYGYGDAVTVRFDASESRGPDGATLDYSWDFGDDHFGSGPTVEHSYHRRDIYIVTLTVHEEGGWADRARLPVALLEDIGSAIGYVTPSDVTEIAIDAVHDHPEIARLEVLGKSFEGQPIFAVELSDDVGRDKGDDEPAVCFEAGIHAREPLGWEAAVDLIEYLVDGYGSDDAVTHWLDETAVWVVPVLNPDGVRFALNVNDNWRKNRHGPGVDVNRNFPFLWNDPGGGSTAEEDWQYRGPYPGSEAEVQTMLGLNWRERFAYHLSYHTSSDGVYHPYFPSAAPLEPELIEAVAGEIRDRAGLGFVQPVPVAGAEPDTQYYEFGTISYVVELGAENFWPPWDVGLAEVEEGRGAWQAVLDLAAGQGAMLYGRVVDAEDGEGLVAEIQIEGIPVAPNGETPGCLLCERRLSRFDGAFWRPLLGQAAYEVTFTSEGYEPQTVTFKLLDGPLWIDVALSRQSGENRRPRARLTLERPSVMRGGSLILDGSASEDPDSDPLSYRWTFGDGDRGDPAFAQVGSEPEIERLFEVDPGTYLIVLEVDDGRGAADKDAALLIVEEP